MAWGGVTRIGSAGVHQKRGREWEERAVRPGIGQTRPVESWAVSSRPAKERRGGFRDVTVRQLWREGAGALEP